MKIIIQNIKFLLHFVILTNSIKYKCPAQQDSFYITFDENNTGKIDQGGDLFPKVNFKFYNMNNDVPPHDMF